jgi:hypothetical protein
MEVSVEPHTSVALITRKKSLGSLWIGRWLFPCGHLSGKSPAPARIRKADGQSVAKPLQIKEIYKETQLTLTKKAKKKGKLEK